MKIFVKYENLILCCIIVLLLIVLGLIIRANKLSHEEHEEQAIENNIPLTETESQGLSEISDDICESENITDSVGTAEIIDDTSENNISDVEDSVLPSDSANIPIGLGTAEDIPGQWYILGNNVCLMKEPDSASSVLCLLYTGNIVNGVDIVGDWINITYCGRNGYVYKDYICAVSKFPEISGSEIAECAVKYLGCPYKWGGTEPEKGFDCSGFIMYVYDAFGIKLNRIAGDLALNGVSITKDELQPGDVILFYYGAQIGHCGIYIGNGELIHAANEKRGVTFNKLSDFKVSSVYRRLLVN